MGSCVRGIGSVVAGRARESCEGWMNVLPGN